ncbi:hypothetical protein D3C78_946600 [compost metagenome]
MRQEQIVRFERSTANLRIEVDAAAADTTGLKHFVHCQCSRVQVSREFVCIPSKKQVTLVRIKGAQHAVNSGSTDFMLKGMSCKCCMVCFKVQLEVILQAVFLKECNCSSSIIVVLVLCWLFWLRLDQELRIKADFLRISNCHMVQTGKVIQLKAHICVQKRLIALAAAPEYIVFSTKLLTNLKALFQLSAGICIYICVAGSACTMHEARIREHINCVPKQLFAGLLHIVFQQSYNDIQVFVRFLQCFAFRSNVHIVECVERNVQFIHKFEISFNACFRTIKTIIFIPSAYHCSRSEWIRTVRVKRMPISNREAKVLFHRFA